MGGDIRKVTGTNQQYRKFPMPRFLVLGIAILFLAFPLFSPGSAMAFMVQEGGGSVQKGAPSKAPPKAGQATTSQPSPSTQAAPAKTSQPSPPSAQGAPGKTSQPPSTSVKREVVNVFVDKIEDGAIYSKDGRKFEIGSTRVIDNSRRSTKMKAAELSFENGSLKAVILK
jgi:hypothetical protein